MSLINYAKNVYSQNGEDGIVEELLSHLGITEGTMVEFGGWDGIWISNVFHHWKEKNFNVISIEGNGRLAIEAHQNFKNHDSYACIGELVSSMTNNPGEQCMHNTIDCILEGQRLNPDELVLMSIDVDGEDMNIFKTIKKYRPIILIIETSSRDDVRDIGQSGYTLVAYTGNSIFVRDDYKTAYGIDFAEASEYLKDDVNKYAKIGQAGEVLYNIYYTSPFYRDLMIRTKDALVNEII